MPRGNLTPEVQATAVAAFGRQITLRELRLMPHIQYVMMNHQKLEPIKISSEERDVLQQWREAGYIEGGASGLSITKQFWDAINAVLWQAYVNYDD